MTTSNDLHRCPAAVGTGAEFSTSASPADVDAVACPLGGGKFVAGGSDHLRGEPLPNPSATTVATGVAGGREAPGGCDSPVESAPVASLSVEDATAAYHDAAQQVALRVAGGFPLEDTLERWETARAAFHAALDAYIAGIAVAEGNDPTGIVRPVEARAL